MWQHRIYVLVRGQSAESCRDTNLPARSTGGASGEICSAPVVMLVLCSLLSVAERFPRIWNTGMAVTEQNRERVYTLIRHLLTSSKLLMVAIFSCITLCSAAAQPLSPWFLPLTIVAILGLLAFYIVRLVRIK